MANVIDDETIEYVGILAKLELSAEEKERAKADMGRMLDYIDKLGVCGAEDVCIGSGNEYEYSRNDRDTTLGGDKGGGDHRS